MHRNFPLFESHLDLAHKYWETLVEEGDWVIDATCGNGQDTLKLASFLHNKGALIGLDIQKEAIERTQALLQTRFSSDVLSRIHLYQQSHVHFPPLAREHPIRLIVYNLGYLPNGDKHLTTMASTTLESVQKALDLIVPRGCVSVTCYPGHEEGAREQQALLKFTAELPPWQWNVCVHTFPNRSFSPNLLLIQKNQ